MTTTPKPAKRRQHVEQRKAVSIGIASPAFGCSNGIGAAAAGFATELQKLEPHTGLLGVPSPTGYDEDFVQPTDLEADVILTFEKPYVWRRVAGRRVVGVVTDPVSVLPPAYGSGAARADLIVCPSKWSREAARLLRTPTPTVLVPFGVDTAQYRPGDRPRSGPVKFRVLFSAILPTAPRKGLVDAIRAFQGAFPDRDDVEMLIRSTLRPPIDKDDVRIRFAFGPRLPWELADMYRASDVLLYPSSAEAFGATALEAMACETPAIHTGATGMADFKDLGYAVGGKTVPAPDGQGEWVRPDFDGLVDALRRIEAEPETARAKATADAAAVAQRFSRARSAQTLLDHIVR